MNNTLELKLQSIPSSKSFCVKKKATKITKRRHLNITNCREQQQIKKVNNLVELSEEERDSGWLWELSSQSTKLSFNHIKIRPKKSLGQNFVKNKDILSQIAYLCDLKANETIVEFGLGTGSLTRAILECQEKINLYGFEKDDKLAMILKDEFQDMSNVKIYNADVMRLNQNIFKEILNESGQERIRIISNLPYNITTDCLKKYLPYGNIISNLLFMIQDEVSLRLCDTNINVHDYRVMTVYTQYFSMPRCLMKIDKKNYRPEPKVDGALVDFNLKKLEDRDFNNENEERSFIKFVNKCFSSKRKKLTNSLQPLYEVEAVEKALREMEIGEMARAQDISVENFVKLYKRLNKDIKF